MLQTMRTRLLVLALVGLLLASQAGALPRAVAQSAAAPPVGTGFTYQGQLKGSGGPITGNCDIAFRLYDAATVGALIGNPITTTVAVTNGLFTTQLDFGPTAFDGNARWLDLQVKCGSDVGFTQLTPRQALTTAPYALYALSAATAATANTAVSASSALTASAAPWGGLTGVPAGFADGVDNDTLYTSGFGLALSGGQFSVVTSTVQARITDACGSGQYIQSVNANGSVNCGADANTTYSAGAGLVLTGTTFTVTGAPWGGLTGVPAGFADGIDDGATYTVSTGLWLTGTTLSLDTGYTDGRYWNQNGNNVTTPGRYLGTTNNMTLTLSVSGTPALRLVPNALSPNLLGGAAGNTIAANVSGAVIGGGGTAGQNNSINASYATLAGGAGNSIGITATYGVVGGGTGNTANGASSVVGGGETNVASGLLATVAGGKSNVAGARGTFVGGGGSSVNGVNGNEAYADASTIVGGWGNYITTTADYASIVGGNTNTIGGLSANASIGGGAGNTVNGAYSTIAGGYVNRADGRGAVVGGGGYNGVSSNGNEVYADAATIAGGWGNYITTTADYATIAGGNSNIADGRGAFVGGGGFDGTTLSGNTAYGDAATIAGGLGNSITNTADYGAIGGGAGNAVHGLYATVPGGNLNTASGSFSFAAGRQARAVNSGAFVWADSSGTPLSSTVNNQYLVRASGGTIIYSNAGATTGVSLAAGAGSWTTVSDRNLKANFSAVDSRAILAQVAALPIQSWNYTAQDPRIRHIGPMAQDFYAAFNVGETDTGISTVDADGVALAAIQGLKHEKDEEIAALQAQNVDLAARLQALEQAQTQSTGNAWWVGLLLGVVLGLSAALLILALTLKKQGTQPKG